MLFIYVISMFPHDEPALCVEDSDKHDYIVVTEGVVTQTACRQLQVVFYTGTTQIRCIIWPTHRWLAYFLKLKRGPKLLTKKTSNNSDEHHFNKPC